MLSTELFESPVECRRRKICGEDGLAEPAHQHEAQLAVYLEALGASAPGATIRGELVYAGPGA